MGLLEQNAAFFTSLRSLSLVNLPPDLHGSVAQEGTRLARAVMDSLARSLGILSGLTYLNLVGDSFRGRRFTGTELLQIGPRLFDGLEAGNRRPGNSQNAEPGYVKFLR